MGGKTLTLALSQRERGCLEEWKYASLFSWGGGSGSTAQFTR